MKEKWYNLSTSYSPLSRSREIEGGSSSAPALPGRAKVTSNLLFVDCNSELPTANNQLPTANYLILFT
ncbi:MULTISPECIES: hypothetical protein [Microcoleaceae]|uniref:hypothetical protein n=1 Tax=Microcoleaceae TaxID=1892252 RepID=UPI001880CE7E|nr:hypothetical protein [Tychonema sp. LEGE 06208]MBE9164145.1 hypothetical protein [Tychonema sp. LEGE 06208]